MEILHKYFRRVWVPKPVWSEFTGGLAAVAIAGPAISRWTHFTSFSIKCCKKAAAFEAPPYLDLPELVISPVEPLMFSLASSDIGSSQYFSKTSLPDSLISFAKSSSFENSPAVSYPRAITQAPVKVAKSISFFGLNSL